MARLQSFYREKVVPELMQSLGVANPMQVPKITKISVNMGVGEAVADKKAMDGAVNDLTALTGQKPVVTKSRKAIAAFKLRQGVPVGARVTLRGARMYEFFDRFVSLSVPRIRDFQGFDPRLFDGRGNLNVGLKEHHIFPEINMEESPKARGMNITFVTTAGDDKKGKALLEYLGMPFKKPEAKK